MKDFIHQINWQTIIVALIGSSVISAIISGFVAWRNVQRIKRVEFEFEYKKFMLEKRKAAYSKVEDVANILGVFTNCEDEPIPICYYPTDEDQKPTVTLNDRLLEAIRGTMWLSLMMIELLQRVASIISADIIQLEKVKFDAAATRMLGSARFEVMAQSYKLIMSQYFHDLENLHDIKAYRAERGPKAGWRFLAKLGQWRRKAEAGKLPK